MTTSANDTLLQCLLALCRYHGTASTAEALTSGLPLEDGKLTPSLFERAAGRVSLTTKVVYKSASEFNEALLPAVLLLENDRACVLMGWDVDTQIARVVYPDVIDAVVEVPAYKLLDVEVGTAIICRPKFRFDKRAPEKGEAKRDHWFWGAMRENIPIYKDVLIAAFFINVLALALPLFSRVVYDRIIPNYALETLWVLASGLTIILIAEAVLRIMRAYFVDIAARRVDIKVSALLMERILGTRLEHKPNSVGSFAVGIRSFESVRDFIASTTVTALIDLPFALIFMAVIAFWIAWQMLIPLIFAVVVVVGYALLTQNKLRDLSATFYRASALRNSTLIEGLVGLDTIKSMGGEAKVQRKWEDTTAFMAHTGMQLRLIANSSNSLTIWVQKIVTMSVLVLGVYLIAQGQLTFGGLIAAKILTSIALRPFTTAAGMLAQYHSSNVALGHLEEIMARPVERPEGAQFLSREMFRGDIEFKNVSFSYPEGEMESVSGVSFKIKAGERVAILGRVGSGKSTLQKLCMGLYQPTSGSIMIDGIDLRQLDPTEYRSRVGYVPQDVTLFYGSLRDNLTISHTGVSDAALVKATDRSGLGEFINRHPKGFDMLISERGDSLSGGQRKSVALARALIHEPPILIMDEPTGSMDHSTETLVKDQLSKFIEGRTWVVVTHRNSLLEMVDRIMVIDNGKLVADGPREQVVQALQQGKIGKAL